HHAIGRASGLDATLGQRRRHGREVGTGVWLRADRPYRAGVARGVSCRLIIAASRRTATIGHGLDRLWAPCDAHGCAHAPILAYRRRVIPVARRLAEQEHLLMALRGPVAHALWHGIGLGPDDLAAQVPAIRTEREGQ